MLIPLPRHSSIVKRKAEACVESLAQGAEVVFGNRGDGALEARDDRLDLALLFRLDALDCLGHFFVAGAARETRACASLNRCGSVRAAIAASSSASV